MNKIYLTSILWYLSWPVIICLTYWVIKLAIKNYEKKHAK
jgi:hypothetical protein